MKFKELFREGFIRGLGFIAASVTVSVVSAVLLMGGYYTINKIDEIKVNRYIAQIKRENEAREQEEIQRMSQEKKDQIAKEKEYKDTYENGDYKEIKLADHLPLGSNQVIVKFTPNDNTFIYILKSDGSTRYSKDLVEKDKTVSVSVEVKDIIRVKKDIELTIEK